MKSPRQPWQFKSVRKWFGGATTKAKTTQNATDTSEEDLRGLSGRLIAAQEEERKRIARDLHDDLNQRLAVVILELSQLENNTNENHTRNQLQEVRTQIQDISTDVHRLSHKLHPSKLDHVGIAIAVKSLCKEVSQTGKLKVNFLEREVPAHLSKDIALCLYRIAQELLHNCLKHSGAQFAQVYLKGAGNNVVLLVSDNGRGFDPNSSATLKGLGLNGANERLQMVGGKMRLRSTKGKGTWIIVSVPVNSEPPDSSGKTKRSTADEKISITQVCL